jgi:PQQ-dependent dehydrogenase (methanol/ethanol family)
MVLVSALLVFNACREKRAVRDPVGPFASGAAGRGRAGMARIPSWLPPDDGQWLHPAKDYANTRFSSLDQIDVHNAANLRLAFAFSTGLSKGHEAAPLVVGSTMYIATPYPNYLYALRLEKSAATVKWIYKPNPDPAAQGVACCDVVNRGAVYADGKIVFNTLDNQTIALDAVDGKEVWKTRTGDVRHGESITMAPFVVDGKVLVGNSGAAFGVRGKLTALELADGKVAWTAWSTGADRDVLLGSRFHPFYAADRGQDLGITSWPPDGWRIGGGTVWGWVSYDPALNLVYYGTSAAAPWNAGQRPGDNKWTAAIFARDPRSGDAIWAYQWSPHVLFDYGGVNENVLVDLPWNGISRQVLLHADRNGYVYVVDRATGEVLSAEPFTRVTSSAGVDTKTGRPREVPEKKPAIGKTVRDICPANSGGKDWQPSAFSPRTGLLYIPENNLCEEVEAVEANYIEGTPFLGANIKMYAGPGGYRGALDAWDPVAGVSVWSRKENFPAGSGALATAGDLVFYGTLDGWFKAVHARSGDLIWQFKTASGIVGQPITYRGPDGKQYVAVLSGVGGSAGLIVSGDVDPRDGTAAFGFANAMRDLPDATRKGGLLYVFSLP